MTQKIGTLLNNHNIYGRTDFFWTSNQGIQLIQTHPSTEILTLVGFVNPQKKKKKNWGPHKQPSFECRSALLFIKDNYHVSARL